MYINGNFAVFELCIKIKLVEEWLQLVPEYDGHARPSQARVHVRGVEIVYFRAPFIRQL